ncbi:MAG TPA: SAM-dependent methyltransferase, partial [Hyphomicrobiaceae bacterium]|nr:SAM-dependent methyltransferase [Hyphomicrobiaceae bacterium]
MNGQRATPLALRLKERIRRDGPMPLAEYMQACLTDPEHGYYRKRHAIGRGGDFVTAPEISQVFGELIGLWAAVVWQQMGKPSPVALVELGPGRGTLMKDALRAARTVPDFRAAMRVHLLELGEALRREQEAALAEAGVAIAWSAAMRELPKDAPTIIVANEFLDALPVSQWERIGGQWHARHVGVNANGAFEIVQCPAVGAVEAIAAHWPAAREGDILEAKAFADLAAHVRALAPAVPLAGLFIDYGHDDWRFGDTVQAVRGHRLEEPLCSPGEADLSSQVNFADFARQLGGGELAVDGPVTQAEFLGSLGIA